MTQAPLGPLAPADWFGGPTLAEVDDHIDVLDRAEPQQPQATWRRAFDALSEALWRARRVRRYCAIPAALLAAILVIVFHGEVWDFDDIRNLFGVELGLLLLIRFVLSKAFAVLEREDRVVALLRYYGARNLSIMDEEALRDVA